MHRYHALVATAVALFALSDVGDATYNCKAVPRPPTFGFGGMPWGWPAFPSFAPGEIPNIPPVDPNTPVVDPSTPAVDPSTPAADPSEDNPSQVDPSTPDVDPGQDNPNQVDPSTPAVEPSPATPSAPATDTSESAAAPPTDAPTTSAPEVEPTDSSASAAAPAPAADPAEPAATEPTDAPETPPSGTDASAEQSPATSAPSTPSADTPTPASNSSTNDTPASGSNSKLCKKLRVEITEVDVGATVDASEDEVNLKVVAIASLPSGGSRIAFHSGESVIVRELDKNDKLVSSSPAVKVPLHDFGDLHADKDGFVLLGTRDAEGGGTANCGNPSNLCGTAPSSENACYDMYLVRYDGSKESWATKLTSSSASLPPYSTSGSGPDVYMIWWYAHHGRLAYDGSNWAAYFGCAISTSEGGCINIHQGDRMKVVDASGKIATNSDSFDWGCSHSGYERITYDTRKKGYASICKTDNNNRIMPPNNWDATIYPVDLAASNLGDIVQDGDASSKKYWATVSNGQGDNAAVHLIHFAIDAAASEDITLGGTDANERAPHLAAIGDGGLLAMWEGSASGGDLMEGGDRTIYAQVLDASTGKAISDVVTVDKSVVGNRYQALKSFPDGSVAYLSKGKTDTSVQVVRFFGC
ncbi:hypothetical protein PHYBOEH_004161 [Phytophthora boehmeriae]|uniref:Uncharacterized protein n=1 Tax=Phytophthora boehmeriae TaxID=109152 RepID=A0A8T1WU38_9STRA|nr:hypothetical protein PHYBOEH_004161 [Phytophthora boehmeriae]